MPSAESPALSATTYRAPDCSRAFSVLKRAIGYRGHLTVTSDGGFGLRPGLRSGGLFAPRKTGMAGGFSIQKLHQGWSASKGADQFPMISGFCFRSAEGAHFGADLEIIQRQPAPRPHRPSISASKYTGSRLVGASRPNAPRGRRYNGHIGRKGLNSHCQRQRSRRTSVSLPREFVFVHHAVSGS